EHLLVDDGHARKHALGREARRVDAPDAHPPAIRPVVLRHQGERRGLAASRIAHERGELALLAHKVEALEHGRVRLVGEKDPLERDGRAAGGQRLEAALLLRLLDHGLDAPFGYHEVLVGGEGDEYPGGNFYDYHRQNDDETQESDV